MRLLLLAGAVLSAPCSLAFAATRHVPEDYPSIAGALASAQPDDVIELRATVLSKHYSPGSSRAGSGTLSSTSSHGIKYRFTTPEGQTREEFGEVLLQNWSKLHEGDPVDIEYLPATKDSRVARQPASAPVVLLIALALLAGGFSLRRSGRST